VLSKLATFHDSDGVAFEAPLEIFVVEHRGDDIDEVDSNPLGYFYDLAAAERELRRLQEAEHASYVATWQSMLGRAREQAAALTQSDIAFIDASEIAHRAREHGARKGAREFLAAHGQQEYLPDPRELVATLLERLAISLAEFIETKSVYALYPIKMDDADTRLEDLMRPSAR
jgi:hypothetical protein